MHPPKKRWAALDSGFFRNSLVYSGSNIPAQAASFISGLVLRRIFPPALMGFWNLRGVAQGVLGTFDLGAEVGAARELPLLAGQGRTAELARCRSTAFWFACFQSLAVTAAWYGYVALRKDRYSAVELGALVVSGILFILNDIQSVIVVFFRSAQAYGPLSRILLLATVGEAVLLPAAAWLGGLGALFGAAVFSAGARLAYFVIAAGRSGAGVSLEFSKPLLVRLVKFGAGLRIVDYPYSIAMLLPLLWVTKLMSIEDLALFSLASGLAGQVGDVSSRVGTVFSTRFLEKAGAGASSSVQGEELRKFLTFQLLAAAPPICWAGAVFLPLTIRTFIPRYAAAIDACRILLVTIFFQGINSGLTTPWVSSGKLRPRAAANLAALAMMALSLAVMRFAAQERSIDGVAWASVLGSAAYFGWLVFAVGSEFWPLRERISLYLQVLLAAAWTFCVLRFMAAGPPALNAGVGLAALLPLSACGLWSSGALGRS